MNSMTTAEDKPKQTRNSEATRQRILAAATQEFAKKGFDGARIDDIARAAQANKQMIYHYFGNKDDLFTTVLEDAYSTLRQHEAEVDLNLLPANEAILALLESTWQHYLENPELIRLLAAENQMEARHLKANNSFQEINDAHVNRMKHLLERGQREGNVRAGIDPMQINISIAALGFFYLSNRFTLATVYDCNLLSRKSLQERLRVMKETIACWIKP